MSYDWRSGGHPLATHSLRFALEKFREPLVAGGKVTAVDCAEALAALLDPTATIVAPMTVAAWERRAESEANAFEKKQPSATRSGFLQWMHLPRLANHCMEVTGNSIRFCLVPVMSRT